MSDIAVLETPVMAQEGGMVIDPSTTNELSEIDKLKIRLAESSGLDPEVIMTSRLAQYDLLLSQGLGIRLHIGGSTLFRVSLDYRLLGLALSEGERRLHDGHIDLGEFFLAPREVVRQFSNLANQARNYLRHRVGHTIGFEFEPGWIWVPIVLEADSGQPSGFHAVKAKLEEYQAAYHAYAEEVAANIEQYKAETLEAVEEAAPLIYARLDGDVDEAPEDFVAELKRFVEVNFPTAERVRQMAYFHIEYKAYPMPSQIALDQVRAAQLELERQKAEEETRIIQARIWGEEKAARQAAFERQRMLLEMQRQYLEEERRRKEEALDPMIREIAGRIQSLVSEVAAGVARTLSKNRQLPGPTARQLRSLVEDLGPLISLAGDTRLEELAAKLDGLVAKRGKLDAQAISSTLDRLEEAAVARVQALGPSMFEYLEI